MGDKKQEVLEAAKRIFAQYGYSKTTMSDIGRAVGLNKASLYYHYKDKLTLFKAVVESVRLDYSANIHKKLNQFIKYKDKIIFFILNEIDFSQEITAMFKYGSDYSDGIVRETNSIYYQIINEDIEIIAEMIRQGVKSGEFAPCDEQLISKAIFNTTDAILNNQCPLHMLDDERAKGYLDIKAQVKVILDLMLNGMKA